MCREGTFQYEFMPFRLMHGSVTSQRMMGFILFGPDYVRVYINDVVRYSRISDEHVDQIIDVDKNIASYDIKLKISRCPLAQTQITLLGLIA